MFTSLKSNKEKPITIDLNRIKCEIPEIEYDFHNRNIRGINNAFIQNVDGKEILLKTLNNCSLLDMNEILPSYNFLLEKSRIENQYISLKIKETTIYYLPKYVAFSIFGFYKSMSSFYSEKNNFKEQMEIDLCDIFEDQFSIQRDIFVPLNFLMFNNDKQRFFNLIQTMNQDKSIIIPILDYFQCDLLKQIKEKVAFLSCSEMDEDVLCLKNS